MFVFSKSLRVDKCAYVCACVYTKDRCYKLVCVCVCASRVRVHLSTYYAGLSASALACTWQAACK